MNITEVWVYRAGNATLSENYTLAGNTRQGPGDLFELHCDSSALISRIKFYLCYRTLNTETMGELNDALYSKIQAFCGLGNEHAEDGNYPAALSEYWKAFDLVPEPKTSWEATTWILVAIGDANFLGKDFQAGVDNLSSAMHCPGAIGNPFIHLRLGQCQLELGNTARAADELMRAYAIEGEEIFEDDDPKYLQFLKTKI